MSRAALSFTLQIISLVVCILQPSWVPALPVKTPCCHGPGLPSFYNSSPLVLVLRLKPRGRCHEAIPPMTSIQIRKGGHLGRLQSAGKMFRGKENTHTHHYTWPPCNVKVNSTLHTANSKEIQKTLRMREKSRMLQEKRTCEKLDGSFRHHIIF